MCPHCRANHTRRIRTGSFPKHENMSRNKTSKTRISKYIKKCNLHKKYKNHKTSYSLGTSAGTLADRLRPTTPLTHTADKSQEKPALLGKKKAKNKRR